MSNSVMFDTDVMVVGHKVVCELVDSNPHKRATKEDVAEVVNSRLGTSLWNTASVEVAIRAGAFNDPGVREFVDVPGRFGGIRELDLEETAKDLAKKVKLMAATEKRKATWEAKRAAKL